VAPATEGVAPGTQERGGPTGAMASKRDSVRRVSIGFDVRVDCSACRVEGARVEAWDPTRDALTAYRCRLCGASGAPGEETPPRVPATVEELERALAAWAAEEALASARELVEAYFVRSTPAEILEAMRRGEVVETTFDVVDYLFSGGSGGGAALESEPIPVREDEAPPSVPLPMPPSLRRVGGPRDELLALAAVAASDGEASADDLEVLRQAAERRGVMPLNPDEIRVYRPGEIDPPATLVQREALLKEMFMMAFSDSSLDESELRVVRAFARAWGVDPLCVQEWTDVARSGSSNKIEVWVTRLGRSLFSGW
jgi:hypothetical protein